MGWPKNYKMANKGRFAQEALLMSCNVYNNKRIANIQEIPIHIVIIEEKFGKIINGYRKKKSTLDFRGTIDPGVSISFDVKESEDRLGLPLNHIQPHQIEYIKNALKVKEFSFIVAFIRPLDKFYLIPGKTVINLWDTWQQNKGKKGYNKIKIEQMVELKSGNGVIVDFIPTVRRLLNLDPRLIF